MYNYIKNIPGLDNTVKHSIVKPICVKLAECADDQENLSLEDPYQHEYGQFTPDLIKMMLNEDCFGDWLKFSILRNWFRVNSEAKAEVIEMLKIIRFKYLEETEVDQIVSEVKTWNIGDGDEKVLNKMIENAKKERKLESEKLFNQMEMMFFVM